MTRQKAKAFKLCPDHPRYKAKRVPRSLCERCWYWWIVGKYQLTAWGSIFKG
jgi:hypothetical protein